MKSILKFVDSLLNNITMYRLVLYVLFVLWFIALWFSYLGMLGFAPLNLILSTVFLSASCYLTNAIFAKVFGAPSNHESVYITILILSLVITPKDPLTQLGFLAWTSIWAMASKYIFAIGKKHIFNPAAFAVAVTAVTLGQTASWWIGTPIMAPFTLIGGLLIVRKLHRLDLAASFLFTAMLTIFVFTALKGGSVAGTLYKVFLYTPLIFFSGVMLTEPLTVPPAKIARLIYGVLVGIFFAPDVHIGSFYFTPEMALIAGNLFSYLASPKQKLLLKLKKIEEAAENVYDFIFEADKKFIFRPGQYLEWTLAHERQDRRGMRRYFTIASSPTENEVRMGVKFYPNPSSYKNALVNFHPGETLTASQLSGDFVLPADKQKKLVFISGGIGVTPFRSMIKYLLDKNEKRNIIHFYCNRTAGDIAYKDIFDTAEARLGIRTIYMASENNPDRRPDYVTRGRLSENEIKKEAPDFAERIYFLSGPHSMVESFEETLLRMSVKSARIKKDYFPGFA